MNKMKINTLFIVTNEKYEFDMDYCGTCNDEEMSAWVTDYKETSNIPLVLVQSDDYFSDTFNNPYKIALTTYSKFLLAVVTELPYE